MYLDLSFPGLLIIVGAILGFVVNWVLGIGVVLVGLALLLWPRARGPGRDASRQRRVGERP